MPELERSNAFGVGMDIPDLNTFFIATAILLVLGIIPVTYTNIQRRNATKKKISNMMREVKRLMGGRAGTMRRKYDLEENRQTRQNLEKARRLLDKILSIDNTYPMALHYYALYHFETGQLDLAEKNLALAIHSDEADPISHYNLGNLYYERKAYGKSFMHYKRAIQINPNFDQAYVGMGNVKFKQGKIYSAMGSYARAARLNKNNADAMFGIGNCYKVNNNARKAMGCYEQAYRLDKTNKSLNAVLSEMYMARKEYNKANEILTEAINIDPKSSVLHKHLGDIRSEQNKETDAVEAYINFLRLTCENKILTQYIKSKFESYLSVEIISNLLKKQKKINYDQFIKDLNNAVIIYLIRQRVLGKLTTAKKKAILRFSSYFVNKVVVSIAKNKNWQPPSTTDLAILAS